MHSSDGKVTWTNQSIAVDFTAPLHIKLRIGALHNTTWDIAVQEIGAASPCCQINGFAGDLPGIGEPNISVRDTNANCN